MKLQRAPVKAAGVISLNPRPKTRLIPQIGRTVFKGTTKLGALADKRTNTPPYEGEQRQIG